MDNDKGLKKSLNWNARMRNIYVKVPNKKLPVSLSLSEAVVVEPHMMGFQNLENTCYLNSSLQALLGLPNIVNDAIDLINAVNKKQLKRDLRGARKHDSDQEVKLVLPFLHIAQAREMQDFEKLNRMLKLLKMELQQVDEQFIGSKMHDATEFLGRLMDKMKDNMDKLFQDISPDGNQVKEKEDGSPVKLRNIVTSNFLSECAETYECAKCKQKNTHRHNDLSFYCTIDQALKPTALEGEDCPIQLEKLVDCTFETNATRELHCEGCGHNTALTTIRLTRLPCVLVLYLKRYDYKQGDKSRKIRRPIALPAKLNLTKYVAEDVMFPEAVTERIGQQEPLESCKGIDQAYIKEQNLAAPIKSPSQSPCWTGNQDFLASNSNLDIATGNAGLPEHDYRLVSVVSHYGEETSSGHYVADVYRFDKGSWFRYDDTQVSPTTEENVRYSSGTTKNGYIFMFIHDSLSKKFDVNNKSETHV